MTIAIVEEMHRYFEREVKELKFLNEEKPSWFNLKEAKVKALDRCYGVQEFAQRLGVPFSIVEVEYYKLREDILAVGVDN